MFRIGYMRLRDQHVSTIDLVWKRDLRGYRIEAPKAWTPSRHVIIGQTRPSARLFPIGGKLVTCNPVEQFDRLFIEFGNVKTPEGLGAFANRFGPLTAAGNDASRGESVDMLLEQAQHMKRLSEPLKRQRGAGPMLAGPTGFLGRVEVSLALDQHLRSILRFTVPDLLTALWLQFGQAMSGGVEMRSCQRCNALFQVGPGHRRRDATFCSPGHKRDHFSLLRGSKVNA